ncbi:MAG: S8 family serine peptidase, partial [Phycisphaerales bacterium]|nr:S8 family serine peptidase [Phycisphaerales bacterium]
MKRLSIMAVMTAAAGLQAGEIDVNLQAIMDRAPIDEQLSALVYLDHQADVGQLMSQMIADRLSRHERHAAVVTALQAAATHGQADLLTYLHDFPKTAVGKVQPFWITSVIAMDATSPVLEMLADRADVSLVALDYPIEQVGPVSGDGIPDRSEGTRGGPEAGLVSIGAPDVWAMGYTGQGVVVSNMDTGVDGNHEALASRWRGLNPLYNGNPEWAFYDPYTNNHSFPFDSGSHGTHTMGSICGGSPGNQIGVAPGSEWIAAAPIDRASISQTVSDAILSFQWFAEPDGNPLTSFDVPHTNSNSWGLVTAHGYPECDQTFWSFIDNCEAAGVIVLFSAGNEGNSGLRRPGDRALDDFRNMAVAATDPYSGDSIASFSSRGPTYCTSDGSIAIKPDIAAPGVNTYSSVPGGYSSYSGTSMASPHVNGVMALMLSANPDLTSEQVKTIIYNTAVDMGPSGKDNDFGYGQIDAVAAVEAALETVTMTISYPDGRPEFVDPNGGTSIAIEISGNVAPQGGSGKLHWSAGGGSGEVAMADVSGGMVGTFPAFDCGAAVSWYISVESV